MIDLHHLRENPEIYVKACKSKRFDIDIHAFLELDASYRELLKKVEALRAEQNAASKLLPSLKGDEKARKLGESKRLAANLKEEASRLAELEERWQRDQLLIPQPPLDKVPEGKDESENVEIRRWGEAPRFSFEPKDHTQIGLALGLFDLERGAKISGARNYFLKGLGARLQHAVLQYALNMLHEKSFIQMEPPHIVKYAAMMGTGYFPGGEEQAYQLDNRDKDHYLIGTSEVSVCAYHTDEILEEDNLPLRYAGYSPCYRREAGTYGKDTQGLYRVHQFYKVEQVVICAADAAESAKLHQEILANSEQLMQALELPYRVVDVCTGDLGRGQVYKNDIEAWIPSRKGYGETHSCSTLHEFQARRLKIRYRTKAGKNLLCHTLNNTLVASPRILIPLIEIHQQADGSVKIPEALRPYMNNLGTIR